MVRLSLLLLLSGCSPYWVQDIPDYALTRVDVVRVSQSEMEQRCNRLSERACSIRLSSGVTQVILGPNATNCELRHELKHAAGWNHDLRQINQWDCGT